MATVVVGVAGGIAAYKVGGLVRLFRETGHDVTVVPTASALQFVGQPTWAALSGNPVSTQVWDRVDEVAHVRIGQHADLVVVAPATANLMARAAAGMADDLLTATLLTAECPVVFAPAMHTEMWEHPATQANVATLRARGVLVLEPAVGRLTGTDSGPGRLPEVGDIYEAAIAALARGGGDAGYGDMTGRTVLVSAGGTREAVDPVRFIGNRSSGKQGYALAVTAARRGAKVTLVSANVALPPPWGVEVVAVESAHDMHRAMTELAGDAAIVVMAAAVADFRPALTSEVKLKKGTHAEPDVIPLERTVDILADLVAHRRPAQVIVGFAAETGDDSADVLAHGRSKLAAKGCDLLVVNDVSGGQVFERSTNSVTIRATDGTETHVARASKEAVADAIWDRVLLAAAG
jgi:phosphopantothenoylcysteine decarboxylase / phosphopantothenate---cysteine ligase